MEILTLWPLSQGEIRGIREAFVDALFADALPPLAHEGHPDRSQLFDTVLTGGYPEVLSRASRERQHAWFSAYVTTILQRDVRDMANIEGLTAMPRLLSLLAARGTALLNSAELSRATGLPQTTLKRYMALLEATFLLQPVPAWSSNLGKRLVKAPRLALADTGLMAHLAGLAPGRLAAEPQLAGPLLHDFVLMELRKQIGWSAVRPRLFHLRTQGGEEVDILLEDAAGRVVGIEVKSSASVGASDFRGLRGLADALGSRFVRGVVLYSGTEAFPFGARLHALPVSPLWRVGA